MIRLLNMPVHLFHEALRQTRKLWVRVVMFGMLALVGLAAARLGAAFLPVRLTSSVDITSVDRLLDIISNSMLAVTTFSLTVMVSVYRATSTQWTPRIHRLMLEDRTTQNTLATFIGAYVYATVGIVLRETGLFGPEHAFLIFYLTVAVMAIIVVYIIRWTLHLQSFGSLIETAREVAAITTRRLQERIDSPCLGGRRYGDVPSGAYDIQAKVSGYIQFIYTDQLQKIAEDTNAQIYVTRDVGSFVVAGDVVARVLGGEPVQDDIADAMVLGDLRSFEQDPRFGLLVLGEMASKALSPGINDSGTAIDVMTRLTTILCLYRNEADSGINAQYDRVYLPALGAHDLLNSGFGTLARDGAAMVEIQIRLQKALQSLRLHGDPAMQAAAKIFATAELRRALQALPFDGDRDRLAALVDADLR
ncbi:DUF2254 domain-containing protein [Yoonia sp. MH D7]